MTPQESKRIQDLIVTFIKAMNPIKTSNSADSFNTVTDVRYFHKSNNEPCSEYVPEGFVDEDLNEILEMTEAELDSALDPFDFDDDVIDQNINICTNPNVVSLNSVATKPLNLDLEVSKECAFQSKLMSVILDDAVYKSITLTKAERLDTADGFDVDKVFLDIVPKINIEDKEDEKLKTYHQIPSKAQSVCIAASLAAAVMITVSAGIFTLAGIASEESLANSNAKGIQIANTTPKRNGHPSALTNNTNQNIKILGSAHTELAVLRNEISKQNDQEIGSGTATIDNDGAVLVKPIEVAALTFGTQNALHMKDTMGYEYTHSRKNIPSSVSASQYQTISEIVKVTKALNARKSPTKNVRSQKNPALDYHKAISFLKKLKNGEIEMSDADRLRILKEIQKVAKSKLGDKHASSICKGVGTYEHVVELDESLSSIISDCSYGVGDSEIFNIKQVLKVNDIVIMTIDHNRIITKIDLENMDGIQKNIYNLIKN